MQSITLKSQIGSDGLLKVHLPEAINTEVEVVLVYQVKSASGENITPRADLYGICADDPIVIDDEGICDAMDDDLVGAFD